MKRITALLIVSLVVCVEILSASDEGRECPDKNSFCFQVKTGDKNTQKMRQLNLISGEPASIRLERRPVDKCTIQTKAEPLPPEAGGTIISLLAKTFSTAAAVGVADECETGTAPATAEPQQAKDEDAALLSLASELVFLEDRIKSTQVFYRDLAKEIVAFGACQDLNKANICSDSSSYDAYRQEILADLQKRLLGSMPATGLLDLTAQKALDIQKTIADPDWSRYEGNRLTCYLGRLTGYKAAIADLTQARQQLTKADDLIRSANWPEVKTESLPAQKNAKLTVTISCSNLISGEPSMDPVTIILTYKDVPRAFVSAGILVTLTPKHVIGTTPINTGTPTTPSFKSVFAVTDSAAVQVVPFSFVNVKFWDGRVRDHSLHWFFRDRIYSLNFAGGIGVNPNSGTKEVEFFAGPGLGIGNFYLHFGAHIGEFKNLGGGFNIGDTVPDKFPSTVPTTKYYTVHPAFALSYRIPLP